MTIKIITDSTSDISILELNSLEIEMVPLKVNFGSDTYIDKITITNEEFYQKLAASSNLPTTTLVNPEQFEEVFRKFSQDTIIAILISSQLSGTYQSAQIAKESCPDQEIYLIDSQNVSLGLALLVKEAVCLKEQGLTAAEIANRLEALKVKIRVYAIIDILKYLVKGGRLSSSKGFIGNVLGLKPIIQIKEGVVWPVGQAKGFKAAVKKLRLIMETENKPDFAKEIAFAHSNNLPAIELLVEAVQNVHDFKSSGIYTIGSVVGSHAGPGTVGLAYFEK